MTQTIHRLIIALLVVSFVFSPEVSGAEITKRVVFPKGNKTSVSYKGKLTREYASYDAYLLRAKKGQPLSVKQTTPDRDASFAVYETKELGPDEDTILPNNETLRRFTGKLPITSEYSVQIYGISSIDDRDASGAAYIIEISLR
ncbi:hypothetical protein BH18ACI1_BH18ACI1_16840 [soil metagenome]